MFELECLQKWLIPDVTTWSLNVLIPVMPRKNLWIVAFVLSNQDSSSMGLPIVWKSLLALTCLSASSWARPYCLGASKALKATMMTSQTVLQMSSETYFSCKLLFLNGYFHVVPFVKEIVNPYGNCVAHCHMLLVFMTFGTNAGAESNLELCWERYTQRYNRQSSIEIAKTTTGRKSFDMYTTPFGLITLCRTKLVTISCGLCNKKPGILG